MATRKYSVDEALEKIRENPIVFPGGYPLIVWVDYEGDTTESFCSSCAPEFLTQDKEEITSVAFESGDLYDPGNVQCTHCYRDLSAYE